MRTRELRIPLRELGEVGATLAMPAGLRFPYGVLLAHGAGNDRFAPLLVHVQQGLARHGVPCGTFNFPYKERSARLPDPFPVLMETYRQVLRYLRARMARAVGAWVIGGKSLGGRVASHLAAEGEEVRGLVFLGYPLHPASNPERLRVEHLPRIRVPMLFVQGTRDALCDLQILGNVLLRLAHDYGCRAELATIDGGDHSFVLPRSLGHQQANVYEQIVQRIHGWLESLAEGPRS
ncbi:MAG: alpha/beta hydrolase [Candidatus Binatia bacterium]|nr:MAG: alpha/beta hydrolase [Candidatus Binatia bacterium]